MKAYGPGLQSSGLAVGKPTEFTVDAKQGGKAPLKIIAQVFSSVSVFQMFSYCKDFFIRDARDVCHIYQLKFY